MIETDKVQNILRIITNIYCFLVASLAMICMNPIIAAVSLAFAVIPLFFPKLFIRKAQINKEAYLEVMSDSSIQTKEYLNGFDIIKIYGVKDVFLNFFSEKKREVARARCQMESFNRLTESVMANLAVWMQLAVYLTAGYLALIGKVSVGVMIGTLQLCAYTVQPVRELMQSYSSLKSVKKVEDHLMSFIKNSEETESVETDVNGVPPIIEFKTVYFSYPNEIQYALKNVTFRLEKGNKYAILGESGSGKSTIVKLVMGYYRQWQGEIYLGEKKLQEWNSTDIGKMLSVVEQNVFLFEDSIKNNITLYKEYNQEQLEQVIKQSGLENVLKDLPQGIDTIVKENGQNFSGGEAQRIAVARALFYDAPILIYDEAAANLDNMTANLFEEMVLNQTGKTVLFITHRINERLLQRYDGIMLFKNGCLVGFDTYWNLISGNRYFCELINKIDVS
jgi:ATP-binding cassette subfamily C protein